jgi:4-oxalocrotonate tautomerase
MPYVNVRVAGTLTGAQKKAIVARITQVMEEEAGKPPAATYVVIDEVPRENWAKSGALLAEPAG